MQKRMMAMSLAMIMMFSFTLDVFAKKSRGFSSRSFSGYSSSSKKSSSFGSSYSSSKSSLFGKSSGGYTGSSKSTTRSYSGGGIGDSSSVNKLPSNAYSVSSSRKSYMENYYKKQTSSSTYQAYKQELNPRQKSIYESSMNRDVKLNQRMNMEQALRTRQSRLSDFEYRRPVVVNYNRGFFGNSIDLGSVMIGMWSMSFLMRASDMFWYHHWNDISPYRNHFNQQQFSQMEQRVKILEEQNIQRDPTYLDPDVDPDLQLSNDYQQKNVDKIYYTQKGGGFWSGLLGLLFWIAFIAFMIWLIRRLFGKRRKQLTAFESNVYEGGASVLNFNKKKSEFHSVTNPLQVGKGSHVEFTVGELANQGMYQVKKIIEIEVGNKKYARYILFSPSEENEYVLEVFPLNTGKFEAYLYRLADTIPFSEEFLELVGQTYMTTPDGMEYQRTVMPNSEERIDGIRAKIRVYDIDIEAIQQEMDVYLWEYQRDAAGQTEYLHIEMMDDTGMFRVFVGEMIEEVFLKVYVGKSSIK